MFYDMFPSEYDTMARHSRVTWNYRVVLCLVYNVAV